MLKVISVCTCSVNRALTVLSSPDCAYPPGCGSKTILPLSLILSNQLRIVVCYLVHYGALSPPVMAQRRNIFRADCRRSVQASDVPNVHVEFSSSSPTSGTLPHASVTFRLYALGTTWHVPHQEMCICLGGRTPNGIRHQFSCFQITKTIHL